MSPPVLASADALHLGEFLPPLIALVVYATAYLKRTRTLARQRRPVATWRQVLFLTGAVTAAAVQCPPLDDIADEILIAHMIQHIVIADLASLLIVLGLTGPVLAPVLRLPIARRLRFLTHPVVALVLWGLDYYIWHLPLLYQLALRHDLVHALEHASFLWFGVLLWMALLGPMPRPAWFSDWARLGYVAVVRFAGAALANVFIWAQTVFYPYYETRDVHAGLSPLSDQNVAGAVMMIEQMILTVLLLGWLFMRFAERDERRQKLLDFAHDQGIELGEARATRAAAAPGSAARLRERLGDEASGVGASRSRGREPDRDATEDRKR